MLKLFKPKKRLVISDIKIPIPMLAGLQNTNLTEEQIDMFLTGGRLNMTSKPADNTIPILSDDINIQSIDDEELTDDYSNSEDDEDHIVDFLNKISKEAQRENQSLIPNTYEDPPHASKPIFSNSLATIENVQEAAQIQENTAIPININNHHQQPTIPIIKTIESTPSLQAFSAPPPPRQEMNTNTNNNQNTTSRNEHHPSSGSSSTTLEVVVPIFPKKKNNHHPTTSYKHSEPPKTEVSQITTLKYQLEQFYQEYKSEHQAHLMFIKERESLDNEIINQINLVRKELDQINKRQKRLSMPLFSSSIDHPTIRKSHSHTTLDPYLINKNENERFVHVRDQRFDSDISSKMKYARKPPMNYNEENHNLYYLEHNHSRDEANKSDYDEEEGEEEEEEDIIMNRHKYYNEKDKRKLDAYYQYCKYHYYRQQPQQQYKNKTGDYWDTYYYPPSSHPKTRYKPQWNVPYNQNPRDYHSSRMYEGEKNGNIRGYYGRPNY